MVLIKIYIVLVEQNETTTKPQEKKIIYIYIYILIKKTALENTYACTLKLQANKEKLTTKTRNEKWKPQQNYEKRPWMLPQTSRKQQYKHNPVTMKTQKHNF